MSRLMIRPSYTRRVPRFPGFIGKGLSRLSRLAGQDVAEAKRLELGTYRIGVPDDDDLHRTRPKGRNRGVHDAITRNGANVGAVRIEVVVGQSINDLIRESSSDGARGLESNGKDPVEI